MKIIVNEAHKKNPVYLILKLVICFAFIRALKLKFQDVSRSLTGSSNSSPAANISHVVNMVYVTKKPTIIPLPKCFTQSMHFKSLRNHWPGRNE